MNNASIQQLETGTVLLSAAATQIGQVILGKNQQLYQQHKLTIKKIYSSLKPIEGCIMTNKKMIV